MVPFIIPIMIFKVNVWWLWITKQKRTLLGSLVFKACLFLFKNLPVKIHGNLAHRKTLIWKRLSIFQTSNFWIVFGNLIVILKRYSLPVCVCLWCFVFFYMRKNRHPCCLFARLSAVFFLAFNCASFLVSYSKPSSLLVYIARTARLFDYCLLFDNSLPYWLFLL